MKNQKKYSSSNTFLSKLEVKSIDVSRWTYSAPRIVQIIIDNEISLALESNPPIGPGELTDNLNQNPYKISVV